jgi:hypothetical protein
MLSKVTGLRVHLERNLTFLTDKINAELRIELCKLNGKD